MFGDQIIHGDGTTPLGMLWYGQVTTVGAFLADYGPGKWGHAQLITPHCSFVKNGITYSLAQTWDGVERLDSGFLYQGHMFDGDGTYQPDGDAPGLGIVPGMTSIDIAQSFKTYVMYRPGGAGSCYVPLKEFTWLWGATAALGANGIWTKAVTQQPSITQVGNYPPHPTWNKLWTNATVQWTP
jgi:hypothetical protein